MSSLFHISHSWRLQRDDERAARARGRSERRGGAAGGAAAGGGSVHGRDEVLMRAQWRRRRLGRGASLNDAFAVALVVLLRAQRAAAADLHLDLLQPATNAIHSLPILPLIDFIFKLRVC